MQAIGAVTLHKATYKCKCTYMDPLYSSYAFSRLCREFSLSNGLLLTLLMGCYQNLHQLQGIERQLHWTRDYPDPWIFSVVTPPGLLRAGLSQGGLSLPGDAFCTRIGVWR